MRKITVVLFTLSGLLLLPSLDAQGKKKKGKKDTEKSVKDLKGIPKSKESKKNKAKADKIRAAAKKLFNAEKYEEALDKYLEAEDLYGNPSSYFYIARCYEELDKNKDAYDYYVDYVGSGDEEKYDEAKEAISVLEDTEVKLTITSDPEDAEVYIDDEETPSGTTPLTVEVKPGEYSLLLKKEGWGDTEETVAVPVGENRAVDVTLSGGGDEEGGDDEERSLRLKGRAGGSLVPISISFGAGATVSTSELVGSYVDASLYVGYRIKQFSVGIGLDNLFFNDSYILAAFPAGTYTLKIWKDLSMHFAVGFGAAYLHAFLDSDDVASGAHWDLVVHADVKVRYKVGPVLVQAVPVCSEILVGVGNIKPAPLAQFAFLAGVAYDF